MWTLLDHPELPSCEDCQQWVHDPQDGWRKVMGRDGKPMRQVVGPPCRHCPKVSDEDRRRADCGPQYAKELSPQNRLAYQHYRQCRAVARFPEDDVVEQNAGICFAVEQDFERVQRHITNKLLGGFSPR